MHFYLRAGRIIRRKKVWIGFLLWVSAISATAQIKWDGGAGDGLWSSPANWVGDIAPTISDHILLDNSVVPGNYTVSLPTGSITTSVATLIVTPSSGNTITLILPSDNIANPGLAVTGSGDAMILDNGAVFQNSSGAASGTVFDITNTFRINNGGHYIHNTDRSNNTIVSQLSTVAGTEKGIFEYKIPTVAAISASGRTYGTLMLSAIGVGKTYSVPSAGSPLTIRGDFIVNSNTSLTWGAVANIIVNGKLQQLSPSIINLSSGSNSPTIQVKGDIDLQGTLTESGTGTPVLELNGTISQNISVTGSVTNSVFFKMNNSAGATLLSPVTLPAILNLNNGKIKTSTANILTLIAGTASTGGSASSFIEGPMKKIGNTDFTFPIGIGTIYAPMTITNVSGEAITDVFTAEYKRQNPQSVIGSNVVSGLDHVSYVEYWNLQQTTGSSSKRISLQVNQESFSKVLASTYVSRHNGSQWTNEGNTIVTGPFVSGIYQTGLIQSANNISVFGNFTLATNLAYSVNALPVKLISFDAVKNERAQILLTWKLAENNMAGLQFVLQRSIDNSQYADIALVKRGEDDFYHYTDNAKANDFIHYRLKMIAPDGAVSFSKIVVVANKTTGFLLSLIPNILSSSSFVIEVHSLKNQQITLMLIDIQGRTLRQWSEQVNAGLNRVDLATERLLRGVYYLVAITSDGEKAIRSFIRP